MPFEPDITLDKKTKNKNSKITLEIFELTCRRFEIKTPVKAINKNEAYVKYLYAAFSDKYDIRETFDCIPNDELINNGKLIKKTNAKNKNIYLSYCLQDILWQSKPIKNLQNNNATKNNVIASIYIEASTSNLLICNPENNAAVKNPIGNILE